MVTTAGSKTSTLRVIMDWIASTISQATGIGSSVRYGIDAWPPLPTTSMKISSAEASRVPPLVAIMPEGMFGLWWMAKARSTRPAMSRIPSSIMNRAPCSPSSPGWNMNTTRPFSSSTCARSSEAAPASMATCESWPHACVAPALVLAKSRPVSSGIGSASMSPRSSTVGPGRPESSTATTLESARPLVMLRPRPSSAERTAPWVRGSSSPSSGWAWMSLRSRIAAGSRD